MSFILVEFSMPIRVNTAVVLKDIRLEKGLSQERLAKVSGIDRTFIFGIKIRVRSNEMVLLIGTD